jgi:anti-sigma factor RsiW
MKRHGICHEHRRISDLIPWYVNGTLGNREREQVETHIESCAACRHELASEHLLYDEMAAEPGVEYMPAPSLKRLQAAIDGMGSGRAAPSVPAAPRIPAAPRHRLRWQGLAAASVLVTAAAVTFVTADHWGELGARGQGGYHTVTTSASRAHDEVIRAVFTPTITLDELQGILAEAHLRIISGPTEAGVYSLAATSPRPVGSSLALLRSHADVRFAESTQPDADGRNPPLRETP